MVVVRSPARTLPRWTDPQPTFADRCCAVVSSGMSARWFVQLSYAIGVAKPLSHNRLIECFRSCSPAVTWGGLWPWLRFTFYPFLTLRFCIRQDMLEEGIVPRACPGEHTECQGKK